MRELTEMWNNTRMVVLTAMCASLYAAVLIPFMVVPLIPGVTHFRPANALPVVCSFLFGPAAAWGAAIGNVIGDFFGGLGPGDLFGFIANFLYALAPYRLWRAFRPGAALPSSPAGWGLFAGVIVVAGMLCAATVGFGLHLLGFVPFTVLSSVVLVNNVTTSLVIAPLLLRVLYPRVDRARLSFTHVLGPRAPQSVPRRAVGVGLAVAGTVGAFVVGNLAAAGHLDVPWLATLPPDARFAGAVLPLLLMAVLGLVLL
jgi:energy-coupling factor transport system substrate-specific component